MIQSLRWLVVLALFFRICPTLWAQNTILTQPLDVASICPGSTLRVPFTQTGAYNANNTFTVQLSDGGNYVTTETGALTFDGSTGVSVVTATIPTNQTAGTTYSLRVIASNPAVVGAPSATSLTVKAVSPAPAVSAVSYCRGVQANQLSAVAANGGVLTWYSASSGGMGLPDGPTPSTDNAGVQTYHVAQTVGITCESGRVPLIVTVNELPNAPPLPQESYTLCQNVQSDALSAFGQNPNWYETATGGTGVRSMTPGTETVGTKLYYVSQTVNGCEGPRNRVAVVVLETPAAPTASQTAYEFCQGSDAVISGTIVPGMATNWYIYGNEPGLTNTYPIGNVAYATVSTVQSRTLVYSLFQTTISGCKGPPSQLINVTVKPTPVGPSVQLTAVCQNGTAPVLQPTGQNLLWYETGTGGTGSATAPVVSTSQVGQTTYFVSQTPNGCESPRVAVSVFVQTTPTLSITGTATTNLGVDVPLRLTFTGVGPYRYKLSDGSTGTSLSDTTIRVLPDRTTTYRVVDVTNTCGPGLPESGAAAVVTVNSPAIQTLAFTTTTLCAGASLSANFTTSGTFNAGSIFKLQYAKVETDSAKISFMDVPESQSIDEQVTGLLPGNTPAGTYWVRVMATNPRIPILGTTSPTLLTVRPLATAALTGAQTIFEGQSATLSVSFTGDGPWNFSYRDSSAAAPGAVQTVQTNANPYSLTVKSLKTTTYFLTTVSNSCGPGLKTGGIAVVTVSPLLGIDDESLAEAIAVFPVPTTTTLTVRINGLTAKQPALLELTDMAGRTMLRHETRREASVLSLDQQSAGTYILRISVGNRTASKRIVKL